MVTISALASLLLVSGPSTSSLTFAGNHINDGANKAFAQEGNDNIIRPQNTQIQFPSNPEQGQTILPQQATISPNNAQQTQEPVITRHLRFLKSIRPKIQDLSTQALMVLQSCSKIMSRLV